MTLPTTKYTSENRSPSLGLKKYHSHIETAQLKRSNSYKHVQTNRGKRSVAEDELKAQRPQPVITPDWSNLCFLIFGTVMGVLMGMTCHMLYIFHTPIVRSSILGKKMDQSEKSRTY